MSISEEILAEAQRLFDAAGITPYGGGSLIVLGLASSAERDLDDSFKGDDGVIKLTGFHAHVQPRLDSLLQFVQERGLDAEIWGPGHYPGGEKPKLKELAVAAGLGKRGKNSLLLHPLFGPWLRLTSVRVKGTALASTGPGTEEREENPLCVSCTACMDICPAGILELYRMRDRHACQAEVDKATQTGHLSICEQCLTACPVGQH